jgi:putative transposase
MAISSVPKFVEEYGYDVGVQLRYDHRVYPNLGQQQALAQAFGCARVVFDDGSRALSSVVLQQALADLDLAYRNYFASLGGKRQGGRTAAPRFRSSKDKRQAIRFTKNSRFAVLPNGKPRLPKIGDVQVRWSRQLPSTPSSVTVIRDSCGRYFVSFVVTTTDQTPPTRDSEVGIDLGSAHFAVLSGGTKVTAPRFSRHAARRLRQLQKVLARRTKGSNDRSKAAVKVARARARVANTRRDWQHELSTAIIRDDQAVYVEDLCVVGLGRGELAKSVPDAGWAACTAMLEHQAAGRADFNDRGARGRPAPVPAARREPVIHPEAACASRSVEGIPRPPGRGERQLERS